MTKIVAGIDFAHYPFALAFLERLRFASAEVRLMHVIESVLPDKSYPDLKPTHPISVMMAEHERQGNAELVKARDMLQGSGYHLGIELHRGDPARSLVEYANSLPADIIAVGSAQKGAWASLFFGSVTKALTASAEQSILVAKSHPRSKDGLTAVLAVDHSVYCNSCIDRLIKWKAQGIRRVTIVTARLVVTLGADQPDEGLDLLSGDIEADILARNSEICERLSSEGIECDHRMERGHANHAIDTVMRDTEADLLILGARGHGFWDRFRLGSISHFQVVATPHNVLVVRV